MELRHLRYFIAVAEYKSIRLASQWIHVTQPAISRQLHDLELELGVELFTRHPRGLTLTPAGESFLHDARQIMQDLDAATRNAQRISTGWQGLLRLGFVENSSWSGIVPEALKAFQAAAPDASLELHPLNTPEQLRLIETGALDGGFIYQYGSLPAHCTSLRLAENNLVLAMPADWQLPGPAVSLNDVAGRPFIGFPRWVYPLYHDQLMAACAALGSTLDIVQEVQTESAILALVSSGVGAALVNSANLGRPPASVRFVKLQDLSVPMPLVFAYAAGTQSPLLERFIRTLTAVRGAPTCP